MQTTSSTYTKKRLAEIKEQGYELDFGTVFNNTIENYKKIAWYGGLMIFVFFTLFSLVLFGIAIAFIGFPELKAILKPENLQLETLPLEILLYVSVATVFIAAITCPFPAGLTKMAQSADKDEEFGIATMFQYYKAPYFVELLIASVLLAIVSSSIQNTIAFFQIPFLGYVISSILSLFTFLTVPFIIFGNLKAVESIKASILVASKQPLTLLGLIVVSSIASWIGFLGCCIGLVFTIPFVFSLYYVVYKEIIGIETPEDLEYNG
ncbi:hypothetical protein [Flavobacterium turcicum]|uniref:Integral membrane protein n=1 Tax=Flavobacterium turcicum TaxID=2764718 RepID=A0ABR7JDM3_9FLAO|nr:hypothetical protein [Flavobacterium turcicum]MBC5862593.1 hypothetical protein [Flavobacterium turcicum]NHL01325.1 hypothetical protein [Flavobacterium turcicum]